MKVHDEMLRLGLLLDGSTEFSCPKIGGRVGQVVVLFYKVVVSLLLSLLLLLLLL